MKIFSLEKLNFYMFANFKLPPTGNGPIAQLVRAPDS